MSEMIERVARAIGEVESGSWDFFSSAGKDALRAEARAAITALRDPTEAQWDGLARQIIFWMDMGTRTPRALFQHLERTGREIPRWLRDEPEMKHLDHVPSKGTRAVLVYRAMIDAAIGEQP